MHGSGGLCKPSSSVDGKEIQHAYNPATALYASTLQAYAAHVGNPALNQQPAPVAPWNTSMATPYGYHYPPGFVPPYYGGAQAVPRWGMGQPDFQQALSAGNPGRPVLPHDPASLQARSVGYGQRILPSPLSAAAAVSMLGGPMELLKPGAGVPHYPSLSGCTVPSLSASGMSGQLDKSLRDAPKFTASATEGTCTDRATTTQMEGYSSRASSKRTLEDSARDSGYQGNHRDEVVMKLMKGNSGSASRHRQSVPAASTTGSEALRASNAASDTIEASIYKQPAQSFLSKDVSQPTGAGMKSVPELKASTSLPPESSGPRRSVLADSLKRDIGEAQYYRARARIVEQQECFVHQLFDLHKLSRLQSLLWTELQHCEYNRTMLHTQNDKEVSVGQPKAEQQPLCKQKFVEDVQLMLSIPQSLRKACVPKATTLAGLSKLRDKYSKPCAGGLVCPQPSRLPCASEDGGPALSAQPTVQQPTHSTSKRLLQPSSLRCVGTEVQSSFQKVTPRKGSTREPSQSREQSQQRSLEAATCFKGFPTAGNVSHLSGGYVNPPFPVQQLGAGPQFGGCFVDPHQAWFAKHYEGRQYSGMPSMASLLSQKPARSSGGAVQPSSSTVTTSKEPGKVQRWWQDPLRTFGEPVLVEPDLSKARLAVDKQVTVQRTDAQKARTGHQKGGSVFLPPLKKRAKYDCHPVNSSEQTPESSALQNSEGKATSVRPQVSKEKKRNFCSAFKPVQQRSLRSKKGSNRLTRDESVASDNSASSCDKGTTKNVHREQQQGSHVDAAAQSAKSAAGILMSMCSSYNNS